VEGFPVREYFPRYSVEELPQPEKLTQYGVMLATGGDRAAIVVGGALGQG
jgi:hypothetical protein